MVITGVIAQTTSTSAFVNVYIIKNISHIKVPIEILKLEILPWGAGPYKYRCNRSFAYR